MLNKNNERELAYITRIEEIKEIPNYDKVEYARIGAGWWVIVRKNQFKVNDLCIYFEVDSKVPEKEPFLFLEKRNYKIKTIKMCGVISQGLIMSAEDFGWVIDDADGSIIVPPEKFGSTKVYHEGDFLTKELGVTYADEKDNVRKNNFNKYKDIENKHKKIFSNRFIKCMMKYKWFRNFIYNLFTKKKNRKYDWPYWVKKTDEERVQNLPYLFPNNKDVWIATEKIDGTSTTFTIKNNHKKDYYVCSRNVCFSNRENKDCYYDTNVYLEMSEKYDMKNKMLSMIKYLENNRGYDDKRKLEYLTIQGETYGGNIQKRNYGKEHRLAIFNIIFKYKDEEEIRLNPYAGEVFANMFDLPFVPVLGEYHLPKTCEELLSIATGESKIDGGMREGIVFRTKDGKQSFKAVSNEFLLKYHG